MSNLHPVFQGIFDRAFAAASIADAFVPDDRCAAVGWPAPTEAVVCQLKATHLGKHEATVPGFGFVTWDDVPRIG